MLKTEHLSELQQVHSENETSSLSRAEKDRHNRITQAAQRVGLALSSKSEPNQRRIAEVGVLLIDTLLQGNETDYCNDLWLKPESQGRGEVLDRLSYKLKMLATMVISFRSGSDSAFDERLRDLAYAILKRLARPEDEPEGVE